MPEIPVFLEDYGVPGVVIFALWTLANRLINKGVETMDQFSKTQNEIVITLRLMREDLAELRRKKD